jgi:hypothetical protein
MSLAERNDRENRVSLQPLMMDKLERRETPVSVIEIPASQNEGTRREAK